jgi:hypothetical protein
MAADLLQELRFTGGRITDNTDVDIASKVDTLLGLFMYTAHQLQ